MTYKKVFIMDYYAWSMRDKICIYLKDDGSAGHLAWFLRQGGI
jgi:hypothetical protein